MAEPSHIDHEKRTLTVPWAPLGAGKIVETIPLRRLGQPAEVAKAIYYLCTDQSSYVTGAELMINGGQHV